MAAANVGSQTLLSKRGAGPQTAKLGLDFDFWGVGLVSVLFSSTLHQASRETVALPRALRLPSERGNVARGCRIIVIS
jgi:hypothetical protein